VNKVLLLLFALLLAISVGVVGCHLNMYTLTMAVSPPGAGTTTPTGTAFEPAGLGVNIQAVAAAGYQFVNWSSAPAGTFGNATAPTTTFTMPAQAVTVTAHFAVVPLDHFKGYWVDEETAPYIGEVVSLEDQFGAVNATVESAVFFCNPVEKLHDEVLTPISNPNHHLTLYGLHYEEAPQTWQVEVDNQFGTQNLTVSGPFWLAVPTQKLVPGDHEPPVGLDHFLLYEVTPGPSMNVVVDLNDEFGYDPDVLVHYPVFFANPVRKTHNGEVTEIVNPEAHLVFYWIWGKDFETEVQVVNQFGEQTLDVYSHLYNNPALLAVPSEKTWEKPLSFMVAAGDSYTVGLKSDGTVVAVGDNTYGQCNVGGWTNIIQVAAGQGHTVGLKSDGTVVAVGFNTSGQCNVGGWTGIIQVAAGHHHTVGLKSNGTVVAVGDNGWGQCNVGGWTNIIQVSTFRLHTVGLKADGTVVAVGLNANGECNVGGWTGIIQVAAGYDHTVGLKADGTVVAVGLNSDGQCNVGGWTNIIQVAAGGSHTVGLKADGTVVAVGGGYNDYGQCNVGGWTGIVQVAAGLFHTVGLKADGTVVAVGDNTYGQCNVGGWTLNV
jgi:alpha-tubulin suppressor-like RCC1 family protein